MNIQEAIDALKKSLDDSADMPCDMEYNYQPLIKAGWISSGSGPIYWPSILEDRYYDYQAIGFAIRVLESIDQ